MQFIGLKIGFRFSSLKNNIIFNITQTEPTCSLWGFTLRTSLSALVDRLASSSFVVTDVVECGEVANDATASPPALGDPDGTLTVGFRL